MEWIRDRVIGIEREVAALIERHEGMRRSHEYVHSEHKEDMRKLEVTVGVEVQRIMEVVTRENIHTRGEIERVSQQFAALRKHEETEAANARAAQDKLIAQLQDDLRRNRQLIGIAAIVIVGLQQVVENAPALLRALETVLGP